MGPVFPAVKGAVAHEKNRKSLDDGIASQTSKRARFARLGGGLRFTSKGSCCFWKKSIDDFSTVMEILDPFIQKILFPILPFTSKLDSRQTDRPNLFFFTSKCVSGS